jgi:UDP-glucose 4,6-dehydratase
MNIAILGNGFISKYLRYRGHDGDGVWVLNQTDDQYHVPGKLSEFIKQHSVEVVINTCGYTGFPNVDACEDNKAKATLYNITIPLQIEAECKATGTKFINISSGCIYTGYEPQAYTEDDYPNFGITNEESSFYSKTKHLCEMFLDSEFTNTIRIRMPISSSMDHKNLISKLLKYHKLIDFVNSKTDVLRLGEFVFAVAHNFKPGIYNAVHSNALSTKRVIEIMKEYDLENPNWEFIDYDDLPIKANRSNCVLSNTKATQDFNFDFGDEEYYIRLNCSVLQRNGA